MPAVMCFGDSNTHGTMPMRDMQDRSRYPRDQRWPGVLARMLGPDWHVMEEGLGGRTTVHDDPIEGAHRSGRRMLLGLLETHRPLDCVIIMLGTNDFQRRFNCSASDVTRGVEKLVQIVRGSDAGPNQKAPAVIVVSPVPVEEVGIFREDFAGAASKSRDLPLRLKEMAERLGVHFADAGTWAKVDPVEGIHLGQEAHQMIGTGLSGVLKNVI